jgi:hypothetical protein
MYKSFSLVLFSIFFLFACGTDEEEIKDIDNPKLVAVAFFEAIYNEKNIDKAASVCAPKLKRLLLHYGTSQSVAKHLFNMSFEKVTDIKPDDTGVKVRERFKNKAVVTVYIEGFYDETKKKDIKRLSLIQNDDNQWVIDEILKDPF